MVIRISDESFELIKNVADKSGMSMGAIADLFILGYNKKFSLKEVSEPRIYIIEE